MKSSAAEKDEGGAKMPRLDLVDKLGLSSSVLDIMSASSVTGEKEAMEEVVQVDKHLSEWAIVELFALPVKGGDGGDASSIGRIKWSDLCQHPHSPS